MIVSAEDDGYGTYGSARRIAARVPRARFLGYRSGGHLLVGHNAAVMAATAAFLNDPIANRPDNDSNRSDNESMSNRA